jgi:transposase-like protein
VNTTEQAVGIGRRRRRRHSAAFKAEAVAACQQPGVSIAAAALARGLNANLLRRWVQEAERTGSVPVAARSTAPSVALESTKSFLPVALSSSPTEGAIRIEVRRGSSTVSVQWPASAARECALLLRELMR